MGLGYETPVTVDVMGLGYETLETVDVIGSYHGSRL